MNLTSNQKKLVQKTQEFIQSDKDIFILSGAAGTGKTTVVKYIADAVLGEHFDDVVLLAPTNRAAKVLSKKTNLPVKTIHSEIYKIQEIKNKDNVVISLKFIPKNLSNDLFEDKNIDSSERTLFIIDESSMISASSVNEGKITSDNPLLKDIYQHVKSFSNANKLIFVGDSYQLPPIGSKGIAPALDKSFLEEFFGTSVGVDQYELKEILRQADGSPILNLAEQIKTKIDLDIKSFNLNYLHNKLDGYDAFIKNYATHWSPNNKDKQIALGWTRKNVLAMNLDIRKELFGQRPNAFEVGDTIYVNARWGKDGFNIQKGELGKVLEVLEIMEPKAKLNFHKLRLEFSEGRDTPIQITTAVYTDLAYDEIESVPSNQFVDLTVNRVMENEEFKKTGDSSQDPYLGAMQIKFAYALTVHKAQGGEWENVYLHHVTNWKDLRWNYTAVTRASKNLITYSRY